MESHGKTSSHVSNTSHQPKYQMGTAHIDTAATAFIELLRPSLPCVLATLRHTQLSFLVLHPRKPPKSIVGLNN